MMDKEPDEKQPPEEQMSDEQWEERRLNMDARMVREFTTDSRIPPEVLISRWGTWSKHVILGDLDETTSKIVLRKIKNTEEIRLQFMPYFKITPEVLAEKEQIIQVAHALLTRGRGPNRERILLSKGVEEKRIISETDRQKGPGIMDRAKSLFGFGGGDY